jgi:hypothetical protein
MKTGFAECNERVITMKSPERQKHAIISITPLSTRTADVVSKCGSRMIRKTVRCLRPRQAIFRLWRAHYQDVNFGKRIVQVFTIMEAAICQIVFAPSHQAFSRFRQAGVWSL